VILIPLTVGRSFRRTDSLCARRRCPMRSSRHRSSCEYARTAQQKQLANGRADLLPLLKPPASSTTLRSVALGKGKTKTRRSAQRVCRRTSRRRPASAGRHDWHRFARPRPALVPALFSLNSAASMQLVQPAPNSPVKLSVPDCLHTAAYARLHSH
jgi:hypothetical protein